MRPAATRVALVLVAPLAALARPSVVTDDVIRERIGGPDKSAWCDLDSVRGGWLTTSFNLAGCRHVNGTGRPLPDSEAAALARALEGSQTVSVVTLASAQLSPAGAREIVRCVSMHGSLVGLILNDNVIDSSVASDVAELLRVNSKLAVLDLADNRLGVEGIMDVLLALEENKALVVLSLQGNDMHTKPGNVRPGDEGGIARGFSGLLHERTALRVLRVGATGIDIEGVKLIMGALAENDHLVEFEIGFDNIGHSGAELIAEALRSNNALRRLTIDGSGVEDDGAEEIAHALKFNTALRELSLMSNALTDVAAKHFADALEHGADSLVELNLGYDQHGMSAEWWHYIRALLRCNADASGGSADAADCKEALIEAEEDRVCLLLEAARLDCAGFLINRVTTVGDVLGLDEARCAALEAKGALGASGSRASCLLARSAAQAHERRFEKDDAAL